jgi:hypothetical protein
MMDIIKTIMQKKMQIEIETHIGYGTTKDYITCVLIIHWNHTKACECESITDLPRAVCWLVRQAQKEGVIGR